MSAVISNNVLTVSTTAFKIEDTGKRHGERRRTTGFSPARPSTPLTGSVFGSDPMFAAAYRPGDPARRRGGIRAEYTHHGVLPRRQNHADVPRAQLGEGHRRVRVDARPDPGSGRTTRSRRSTAESPSETEAETRAEAETETEADAGDGGTTGGGSGGCGCDVPGNGSSYGLGAAVVVLLAACRRRTRRAS